MDNFLGEYEVKLDEKNRITLPSALKKQLDGETRFVLNRSFDKCINFYPYSKWQNIEEELSLLNPFIKKERDFIRYVRGGATEITLDNAGRFVLPRRLIEYANINAQLILLGSGNSIEIWDVATYDAMLDINPDDFSALAEEVMSSLHQKAEDNGYELDDSIIVPIMRKT